jgi:hypothetical protein
MKPQHLLMSLLAIAPLAAADSPAPPPATKSAEAPAGAPERFMGMTLPFDDDFGPPNPKQWEPADPPAWKFMADGDRHVYGLARKSAYQPKVRSPQGIAWRSEVLVGDFVLDARVRSTTADYGHRDMCLLFGGQTPERFYYVHLGLKADAHSNGIFIVNNQPRTLIAGKRNDGTIWSEGYHHVRVMRKIETGTIEVYFDNMAEPIMHAQDKTFTWGRVGIGSFDDTGNFDRVTLWGRRISPQATRPAGVSGPLTPESGGASGKAR